ncbi:hypothetical protein DOTSEDRAFT_70771 [Dothistroma septosporum NZE10]|uniref:DNA-directed RNA polymerase III subunit RPC6 n=1 Tax=Dothistroma septosporum (strain NZE10 / CBS 128990) TaxID=675120 RepID=N1PVH4_DOTSN|nr:hypothetical protein DOTSEDRAFT_70771 [Dothistroma septosporum NZE10]
MSSDLADRADQLYTLAAANAVEVESGAHSRSFTSDDLLSLGGFDDNNAILPLIGYLTKNNLFRTLQYKGKLGWSVRPRDAARQIKGLDRDEKAVYEEIEAAHTDGVWVRDIKKKTNIGDSGMKKAISKLEGTNLIKSITNIRSKAQKTYILSHLKPSESVTGNSFYDAGDLDESFRDELMNLIIFWVRQHSWKEPSRKHKVKKEPSPPVLGAEDKGDGSKKRKRTADIEELGSRPVKHRSARFDPETDNFTQIMYKAGTHNYPTAEFIHAFLADSEAILPTKRKSLTVQEIQGCIDVLCWDEKLEKVPTRDGEWGYRTVRGITFKPPGSQYGDFDDNAGTALTQAPCGKCPVFDLCHEGGPVNPQECVYFTQWLDIPK